MASLCQASGSNDDSVCKVVAVNSAENGRGKQVTLRPMVEESNKRAKPRDVINAVRDSAERSLGLFVLPVNQSHDGITPLQEALDAVPSELVAKPIELLVGASHRLMFDSKCLVLEQDDQLIGMSHSEPNPGSPFDRLSNVVAVQPGMAKLTYLRGGDFMSVTRMTFHVKTDTRELELHIVQQFPTAKGDDCDSVTTARPPVSPSARHSNPVARPQDRQYAHPTSTALPQAGHLRSPAAGWPQWGQN